MGLLDDLRGGIATANSETADIQGTFTLYAWTGQDTKGKATYAAGVSVRGIIEINRKQRMRADGTLVTTIATITVLEQVSSNGAAGRREPIDPRDKVVLPDGTTGPIVEVPDAVLDRLTSLPLLNVIYIGEGRTT